MNSKIKKGYLNLHKASGLKIGDKVTITRIAKSHENGWDNTWITIMDDYIGKQGKIVSDAGILGFTIVVDEKISERPYYSFPYFVLKKVVKERSKKQQAVSMRNFTKGTIKGQIALLAIIEQKDAENPFLSELQRLELTKSKFQLRLFLKLMSL